MPEKATPMMRQYMRIKGELPRDVILFFRLGDFYEMFYEDAKAAAPILDIALTRRNDVPMCGVPYHAVDSYLAKIIRAGRKVAICDQVEDAAASNKIVRREVTRVVTPGTVVEDSILKADRNNFLVAVYPGANGFGLAWLDLSTGAFRGEEPGTAAELLDGIRRLNPSECIVPAGRLESGELGPLLREAVSGQVTAHEDWAFDYEAARDTLVRHFGVHSLEGFGCEGRVGVVSAAGGILHYVTEALRHNASHVRAFRLQRSTDYLVLDEATVRNLDLVPTAGRGGPNLLQVLDVTRTAMGARKMREWLLRPLAAEAPIVERHRAVEALGGDRFLLESLREELQGVRDLERLVTRLGGGGGNARDVLAVGRSLARLPGLRERIEDHAAPRLAALAGTIRLLPALVKMIDSAIVEEPPVTLKDGGLIRPGFNAELDELREATTDGRSWLAEYQAQEQDRTGIKNLKVRHNKVFGYYIEVSRGQLGNVPDDYSRKQTLVNAERFITPELKQVENRILGAQERAAELEYEVFLEVRRAVVDETSAIQATADAVAELDVLCALADRALILRYVRPEISGSDILRLKECRHPVIEQMPDAERFVPNDTLLDCSDNQLVIITGPNMAGKSTYIRQVALAVIMAQMGSFVPAREAEVGLVDRVFTRVGASDDLARGRSTFMVEMQETANILNNATPRSLIVLDEIGRGTSTFDGISIAWAVAEHLHESPDVKAKTLFATHYHELTDLAKTLRGVRNYNVLVREKGHRVVFLRRIVPGGSDKSYGIQVARLAGLPDAVIDRAGEILENLEEGELAESGQPRLARHRARKQKPPGDQLSLFDG